eukprot:CAMPEP_0177234990 /NCGR_PEP_ID=MMETSP0367-20130122/44686_1 /TAXON_ID=447022 ORGANISM="Scrippsiella hangoei-like, Strain SHHI-4" /NCGR_SAMPLE_ID=MMETSP0367 /ASSEMBLY_ACC=CAM_ASM_000362 /LENGTH=43 /DNA_ID= /DNA_START= /DNA_END= /DNA_ORIENTATION=
MMVTESQWTQYLEVVEATVISTKKRSNNKKPPRFMPTILAKSV